jgi:hypothetical protein
LVFGSVAAEGGRNEGQTGANERPKLHVYRTEDGALVRTTPLEVDERLLAMDPERGRLFLHRLDAAPTSARVRVLDVESLRPLAEFVVPRSEVPMGLGPAASADDVPEVYPVLDRPTGRLASFDGTTVRWLNPLSGQIERELPVDVLDGVGPIANGYFTDDGRTLYLALFDATHPSWEGWAGTLLTSVDVGSGRTIEKYHLHAGFYGALQWSDRLLAQAGVYKDWGSRWFLSAGGHEQRRVTESAIAWTIYDSTRNLLIGVHDSPVMSRYRERWAVVADADSLRTRFHTRTPGTLHPAAYDAATDQLLGPSPDVGRLQGVPASALQPEPAPTDAPAPDGELVLAYAHPATGALSGVPALISGRVRVRPPRPAGSPTASPDETQFFEVISRDGGASWLRNEPAGIPDWPSDCLAVSPTFDTDQTLFGCVDSLGVFRSTDGGRSWLPRSAGIRGVNIREIRLSPAFAVDRTLFAVSYTTMAATADATPVSPGAHQAGFAPDEGTAPDTAWRSVDAGETWEPIGRFAALAVSPHFAEDQTLMAFEYLGSRFFVSNDAGGSWQARGRLPELESTVFAASRLWIVPPSSRDPDPVLLALGVVDRAMGGPPQWPSTQGRLFRSVDGGATWDLAWGWPDGVLLTDGALMGPIETENGGPRWLLQLDAFQSSDLAVTLASADGVEWWPVQFNAMPHARVLAAWPDGKLLVARYVQFPARQPHRLIEAGVDDLQRRPDPTPSSR